MYLLKSLSKELEYQSASLLQISYYLGPRLQQSEIPSQKDALRMNLSYLLITSTDHYSTFRFLSNHLRCPYSILQTQVLQTTVGEQQVVAQSFDSMLMSPWPRFSKILYRESNTGCHVAKTISLNSQWIIPKGQLYLGWSHEPCLE